MITIRWAKGLLYALCLLGLIATCSRTARAQVPPELWMEMSQEKPEHLGPAIELTPSLVIVILHYHKAKLWVVTRSRTISPGKGFFQEDDVEVIFREKNRKFIELYKKPKGEKT